MLITIYMNTYDNIIVLGGLHFSADWSVVITFLRLVLRKYSPLFQIFATFCAGLHWPDDLATDHLPPDICHPGQTEVAAAGIFKIFGSVLSYTHVGKANISHFLVL